MNKDIRKIVRQQRKALSQKERMIYSKQATANILSDAKLIHDARNIAVFLSLNEEIDTTYLIEELWLLNKALYLPKVIAKNQELQWLKYEKNNEFETDSVGMLIPKTEKIIPTSALDLVITPLVAWNEKGFRIGMGGGFYDRTFAQRSAFLLGFAYELQKNEFTPQDWDIKLDALATEEKMHYFI